MVVTRGNRLGENHCGSQNGRQGEPLTMEAFLQAMTALGQAQALACEAPRRDAQLHNTIVEFKKLSPPAFGGTTDPLEAEKWLTEIEKTFTVLPCTEEEKVSRAAYMLQGSAHDWWLMVQRQHEDDGLLTWNGFRDAFYDKYFPESVRRQKEDEFIKLQQRSKTVAEYEADFTRLSKFAPSLVATDLSRARRFESGLRPRIKEAIIPF